ncbi:MAG: TatD family deoxyribonuclease [Ruminococcaceae bacterium]|nr:TatD family deoxyribonuclease [Oscillospiraceae bacterium]
MFIDSHAHYNAEAFAEDRDALLASLPAAGVDAVVNIGDSLSASETCLRLSEQHSFVYAAVGVHPENAAEITEEGLRRLEKLAGHEKAVAIGEIGLDYYYDDVPRDIQRFAFREQLKLAKKLGMPVVIHDRDAHGDCLQILQDENITAGVMHCFSGSVEFMREVVRLGLYVALGGVVTYKNARHTVDVAREVSPDRLLLETDCPYLSPVPHRGKRNSSLYLRHTAEKIAEIRGVDVETVATITAQNARRLFGII